MTRSDEAEWWFNAVYEAVQQVPYGRVTSYGHIARLLGRHTRSGMSKVGVALKHLPTFSSDINPHFHDGNVPWQRVINAKGVISPRGPGGAARQATALRQEGVTVELGSLGELSISFGAYGWFPTRLPSEGADDAESDEV
ncbi:hypothetical protein G7Y79_00040g077280 [Physcia stellaris]|nr:hypothetical protein G7Y79_00040g077280 [Physcia stellaris]